MYNILRGNNNINTIAENFDAAYAATDNIIDWCVTYTPAYIDNFRHYN